ncbi:MAG: hypothetical protein P8X91_07325 [Candidatus Bathyarchaeota archaeon]
MEKNQIFVSIAFLSILIFLVLGIIFTLDSGAEPDMGGMMGGGTTTGYSLIIAIIFFGLVIVITVGLLIFLFYTKRTDNDQVTQKLIEQLKSKNEKAKEKSNITVPIETSKIDGYLPTGNSKIDNLLYGGIAPNTSLILTAFPSHERDIIIKGFLETGLKNNEIVFYITCDPSFSKSLLTEYPIRFHLIACYPISDESVKSKSNVYKVGSITNLTEINITLTKAIRKLDSGYNHKRLCVNIVSDVLLQYGSVKTRKWLTDILSMLHYDGFTVFAIINPKIHSSEDIQAILELFDGEIVISELESIKGNERWLKIVRMNKQKYLSNEINLN